MRTIKELLELMLDHQEYFRYGLCEWATDLWVKHILNSSEYYTLMVYIKSNRPSRWSSWDAFNYHKGGYWWTMSNINPRIKWLNKHIKKNTL
jgi:hypothetical protein